MGSLAETIRANQWEYMTPEEFAQEVDRQWREIEADVNKFNQNHDERGRFSSDPDGGSESKVTVQAQPPPMQEHREIKGFYRDGKYYIAQRGVMHDELADLLPGKKDVRLEEKLDFRLKQGYVRLSAITIPGEGGLFLQLSPEGLGDAIRVLDDYKGNPHVDHVGVDLSRFNLPGSKPNTWWFSGNGEAGSFETTSVEDAKRKLNQLAGLLGKRGNPYHVPAGSPQGGQFTSGDGESSVTVQSTPMEFGLHHFGIQSAYYRNGKYYYGKDQFMNHDELAPHLPGNPVDNFRALDAGYVRFNLFQGKDEPVLLNVQLEPKAKQDALHLLRDYQDNPKIETVRITVGGYNSYEGSSVSDARIWLASEKAMAVGKASSAEDNLADCLEGWIEDGQEGLDRALDKIYPKPEPIHITPSPMPLSTPTEPYQGEPQDSFSKFNPNHDEWGRFAEAPGGGVGYQSFSVAKPMVNLAGPGKTRDQYVYYMQAPDPVHSARARFEPMPLDPKDGEHAVAFNANPDGMELFCSVFGGDPGQDKSLSMLGVSIPPDSRKTFGLMAAVVQAGLERDGAPKEVLRGLVSLKDIFNKPPPEKSVILLQDAPALKQSMRQMALNEELNHSVQNWAGRLLPDTSEEFLSIPLADKAAKALTGGHPDYEKAGAEGIVFEVGARLMDKNRYRELDLEPYEARNLAAAYVKLVRNEHPGEAAREIARRVFASAPLGGAHLPHQMPLFKSLLAEDWFGKGGAGSGNFGHAGRPGLVGGSSPGGGFDWFTSHGSGEGFASSNEALADRLRAAAAHPSSAQEQALLNPKIVSSSPLGGGIYHGKRVVTLEDGSKAAFKPSGGEGAADRDNISPGFAAEREAATWQVAKLVGMDDMVAPSVLGTFDGKPGVFIGWQTGKDAWNASNPFDSGDAVRAAVFDYVIGNEDRHDGNWTVDDSGRLHLIDHNLTFPEDDNFPQCNYRFIDHMSSSALVPPHLVESYVKAEPKIMDALIKLGLPSSAREATFRRIEALKTAHTWETLKP